MDETSFARLDGLRRRHFPPERNLVPAHVTLFHALPGLERAKIAYRLTHICTATPHFVVEAEGAHFLGRGVAYRLKSPELSHLRQRLAQRWESWLTPQDRQPWRPHVTVQNKVNPEVARQLHADLTAGFEPFHIEAQGLLLWRYDSGPWHLLQSFAFGGDASGVR